MQAKLREVRTNAVGSNDVCAMDSVRDELFDGRKIRHLTVIDIYIRLPPAIGVR